MDERARKGHREAGVGGGRPPFASRALLLLVLAAVLNSWAALAGTIRQLTFGDGREEPGDEVVLPVEIDDTTDVVAVDFRFRYDKAVLAVQEVCLGAALTGVDDDCVGEPPDVPDERPLDLLWGSNIEIPGEVTVSIALAESPGASSGSLVEVRFRILDRAACAPRTDLHFDMDRTALNEGGIAVEVTDGAVSCASDAQYVRGDTNADGGTDISDAIYLLNSLFTGGPDCPCREACDVNDDGGINIADPVYELNHLFGGGPAIPSPAACGETPDTPDVFPCDSFPPCGV